jgi:hypothetical protein
MFLLLQHNGFSATDGSLFCRTSNRVSDLRHDEEEWTSVYDRFCPRGVDYLRHPDCVLQNEPALVSRGDCERAATGAHTDLNRVWRHLFLRRAGTLWCHADAKAVARRCFAQSGGAVDDCWLVIHLSDRGRQRIRHSGGIGRSNPCWAGISSAARCCSVHHYECSSDFVRRRWNSDLVRWDCRNRNCSRSV